MAVLVVRVLLSPNSLWLFTLSTPPGLPGLVAFPFARIQLPAGEEALPKGAARVLSRTRCPANNCRRERDCNHRPCNMHSRANLTPRPSRTDDAPTL